MRSCCGDCCTAILDEKQLTADASVGMHRPLASPTLVSNLKQLWSRDLQQSLRPKSRTAGWWCRHGSCACEGAKQGEFRLIWRWSVAQSNTHCALKATGCRHAWRTHCKPLAPHPNKLTWAAALLAKLPAVSRQRGGVAQHCSSGASCESNHHNHQRHQASGAHYCFLARVAVRTRSSVFCCGVSRPRVILAAASQGAICSSCVMLGDLNLSLSTVIGPQTAVASWMGKH